ncbi:permease [bacterium]|nr:permease [bacterium]
MPECEVGTKDRLDEIGCDAPKHPKVKEGREEKTFFEKSVFSLAWLFFFLSVGISFLWKSPEGEKLPFFVSGSLSGVKELSNFLFQHLISAMIPAFFLAAAISTFFSKDTIVKTLGKRTNPFLSYPLAAVAGAILTICSCGILPIFMSLIQSGAGIGPAVAFLYASPAINLISVIYTWKMLPISMLWARIISVFISAIALGFIMDKLFYRFEEKPEEEAVLRKGVRSSTQEWLFFGLLVLVMLTSTEALAFVTNRLVPVQFFGSFISDSEQAASLSKLLGKTALLFFEIVVIVLMLKSWFSWDETRKWLKRTGRQACEIMPMVFLGVFFSGFLGGAPSLVDYLGLMKENSISSNLISSLIGAMLYFGSIVGVNVVQLFMTWGMHKGPALSLLLSGPVVSLPSILALISIIEKKKTLSYVTLVIIFSALCGLIFGGLTP